jgi:hypothetical protein
MFLIKQVYFGLSLCSGCKMKHTKSFSFEKMVLHGCEYQHIQDWWMNLIFCSPLCCQGHELFDFIEITPFPTYINTKQIVDICLILKV